MDARGHPFFRLCLKIDPSGNPKSRKLQTILICHNIAAKACVNPPWKRHIFQRSLCAKTPSRSGSKERPFCASLKIKRNSSWQNVAGIADLAEKINPLYGVIQRGWEIPGKFRCWMGRLSINGWLSIATFDYWSVAVEFLERKGEITS